MRYIGRERDRDRLTESVCVCERKRERENVCVKERYTCKWRGRREHERRKT